MHRSTLSRVAAVALATVALLGPAGAAAASPVCTDGYMGGPPLAACGNRVFPEAAMTKSYVQFNPDPLGFREAQHGMEFLAQKYPRWVSLITLREYFKDDKAVSAGSDGIRSYEDGDTGDGRDLFVLKITDHQVPDKGKDTLFFSLSIHGNERGGLEGGLRATEDLAMAAETSGQIVDGVDNYVTNTGREPEFHSYEVKDVLAKQVVYLAEVNPDGWAAGDVFGVPPGLFTRANGMGTDLNRQMPTVGRIDISRNPLEETEASYMVKFMKDVKNAGNGKLMAYGADVHGELTSRAYVDIMYPAGQFDSVQHRRLMSIAERTKSVIDETLYAGIQNQIEEATGGNESEGAEDVLDGTELEGQIPANSIPTMPAHWATVWDTLGYTDTGFLGDYLATDMAFTGMDYEIFLNHTVPEKAWNVYLQENHINASRAIIKTAMAYAITERIEFNDKNWKLETGGQPGYVINPDPVTDKDKNGPGVGFNKESDNGTPIKQVPYSVTNQRWFTDTSRLMPNPFRGLAAADVANDPKHLDQLDTLVLADVPLPRDPQNRKVDAGKYWTNIKDWVSRGGNLVLTDRALHALGDLGLVEADSIEDIEVYQPYADIQTFEHALVAGLRANARQLVEAPALGYEIGNAASPMTVVDQAALEEAGGTMVGTTGTGKVSVGQIGHGKGLVRLVGGALPMPTEDNDHRYGLRNYALTYSGLYIMENAVRYDAAGLGSAARPGFSPVRPPVVDKPKPGKTLAATGGDWEMAAMGLALFAFAMRQRTRRTRRSAA